MAGRSKTRKEIASKLKDDTLDMSYCELDEVPVRQIACIPKVRNLNLSNNNLTSLLNTFANLRQVIILDLSRNKLQELPENFGLMTQLKHLDLYGNQISRLPLSLGDLKNLKWLDLKGNPLTEAVATVAGPCNNTEDCQVCARNVVHYLSTAKSIIREERLRRLYNLTEEIDKQQTTTAAKKEGKKKKKKNVVKECKVDDNTADSVVPCDCAAASLLQHDNNGAKAIVTSSSTDASAQINESRKSRGIHCLFFWIPKWFYLVVIIPIILLLMFHITFSSIIVFEHYSAMSRLKSSLGNYHTHTKDLLESMIDNTWMQINSITDVINDFIRMCFKGDT